VIDRDIICGRRFELDTLVLVHVFMWWRSTGEENCAVRIPEMIYFSNGPSLYIYCPRIDPFDDNSFAVNSTVRIFPSQAFIVAFFEAFSFFCVVKHFCRSCNSLNSRSYLDSRATGL